jgi:membrane-bound metal-dependent hydrolase YbcI (DUF457 family)
MLGRTHALSGAAAWLAAAPLMPFPLAQVAAGTAVAAVGALLPDLDHPQAKATRVLGPLRYPVAHLIAKVSGGHRAGTHYLVTALIVGALLWTWQPWIGAAVALGMAAHSVGDMLTVEGVRWLWPLPVRFRGPIHTGSKVETLAVAPLMALAIAWFGWVQAQAPTQALLAAIPGINLPA